MSEGAEDVNDNCFPLWSGRRLQNPVDDERLVQGHLQQISFQLQLLQLDFGGRQQLHHLTPEQRQQGQQGAHA
ncbi:hypothetical protein EYF80_014900 [Liparis tanakae]|uniref:Uncharacterized protein n=1 Tax=Liparis tanakae TaxID=230148 RepID=A0A4Z2IA93_9TELE|nr:hypothetical protein EYF80_014900 [Liparis tanakae]